MCVHACVHGGQKAREGCPIPWSISLHLVLLRPGTLCLKFTSLSKLAAIGPGISLPVSPPKLWACRDSSFFFFFNVMWALGIQTQVLVPEPQSLFSMESPISPVQNWSVNFHLFVSLFGGGSDPGC